MKQKTDETVYTIKTWMRSTCDLVFNRKQKCIELEINTYVVHSFYFYIQNHINISLSYIKAIFKCVASN